MNCVALLRAVNLAGKNMVAMADLRALLTALGFPFRRESERQSEG